MRRMRDLIKMVNEAHPNDQFFATIDDTLRSSSQARAIYTAYDQALSCLDEKSWGVLSKKAIEHYPNHRTDQTKQHFFNQLNEAFAYQFLLQQGYKSVEVLQEDGTTKPDISYSDGVGRLYCEVKSIGVSDDELSRFNAEESFDTSIYRELSAGFLNKLDYDLKQAHRQISSQGGLGLVFVVARFDDFTLSHYGRYREQISEFLNSHEVQDVFVKVGLLGSRHIHKRGGRLDADGY
jgi:hypothetical protein